MDHLFFSENRKEMFQTAAELSDEDDDDGGEFASLLHPCPSNTTSHTHIPMFISTHKPQRLELAQLLQGHTP